MPAGRKLGWRKRLLTQCAACQQGSIWRTQQRRGSAAAAAATAATAAAGAAAAAAGRGRGRATAIHMAGGRVMGSAPWHAAGGHLCGQVFFEILQLLQELVWLPQLPCRRQGRRGIEGGQVEACAPRGRRGGSGRGRPLHRSHIGGREQLSGSFSRGTGGADMRGELMLVGALHGGVGRDGRRPRSPAAGAKGGEVYGSWKDAPDPCRSMCGERCGVCKDAGQGMR